MFIQDRKGFIRYFSWQLSATPGYRRFILKVKKWKHLVSVLCAAREGTETSGRSGSLTVRPAPATEKHGLPTRTFTSRRLYGWTSTRKTTISSCFHWGGFEPYHRSINSSGADDSHSQLKGTSAANFLMGKAPTVRMLFHSLQLSLKLRFTACKRGCLPAATEPW